MTLAYPIPQSNAPDQYTDLLLWYPPQLILDEEGYQAALAVMDLLMRISEPNEDQKQYVDLLYNLIHQFEKPEIESWLTDQSGKS